MRLFATAILASLLNCGTAYAEVKVAVSIKPIHSLVASVMQGVETPTLIVDGSNSPHTYSMRPSDAAKLEHANVIFWVGPELEAFLEKPIVALGEKAKTVSLIDAQDIVTLPVREEAHDTAHNHEGADAHIWLDPENAKAILNTVALTLSESDPGHSALYTDNARKAAADIDAMQKDINTQLSPARGHGFLVFHDAYQYFETRFAIPASGAIALHPENAPGAATLSKLKAQIVKGNIKCIFSEPQFDNKLTSLLLEGSNAKAAVLDPIGANLEPGPGLYQTLMRNIASALNECLATP